MGRLTEILGLSNDGFARAVTKDVAVVIPAFNEEVLVGRCIASVLAAGVPAEHVFVVNDCSSDGTADVVRRFAGVNLLENATNLGKLGGLRHAIEQCALASHFRYLSLLDADSHVAPDYFREVVIGFAKSDDVVVVCGAPESDRHNWLTAYRALEYAVTLRAFRAGQDVMNVITVAPGCASTYHTRILDALDFNGETLVEDMDLTIQIHRRRLGRIAFALKAVTYTQDPHTLRQYIGQLTRWYSGTWQVMLRHRLPFGRQRIDAEIAVLTLEGLFYACLLLAAPIVALFNPMAVVRALVLDQMIWLALAVGFAVHLRRGDILRAFPLFLFIRCANCVVLLHTLWREVVLRDRRRTWFSPRRYSPVSTVTQSEVCGA
jgi:poly-beta-1,6-N-acetyl-D-glucosamine synthase